MYLWWKVEGLAMKILCKDKHYRWFEWGSYDTTGCGTMISMVYCKSCLKVVGDISKEVKNHICNIKKYRVVK